MGHVTWEQIGTVQAELDRLDAGIDASRWSGGTMVTLSSDDEPTGYELHELLAALQELPDGAGYDVVTERVARVSVTLL